MASAIKDSYRSVVGGTSPSPKSSARVKYSYRPSAYPVDEDGNPLMTREQLAAINAARKQSPVGLSRNPFPYSPIQETQPLPRALRSKKAKAMMQYARELLS